MLKNSLSPSDSDSLQFLYFKICYLEEYQNLQVLSNTFLRMCLSSWKRLDFNDHLQMHCIFLTAVELHATNSAKRNTAFTNRNSRDIKAFLTMEKALAALFPLRCSLHLGFPALNIKQTSHDLSCLQELRKNVLNADNRSCPRVVLANFSVLKAKS